MASPSYFGKLLCFQAAYRKNALIPFGLFSPGDNLNFIAEVPAPTVPAQSVVPVNYSAAIVVDSSAGSVFGIAVTGNITSTVLNFRGGVTIPTGTVIQLRYQMNSTGGWTVVLPANLTTDAGFAVDPTPSRTTVMTIEWNGSGWVFFGTPFSVTGS